MTTAVLNRPTYSKPAPGVHVRTEGSSMHTEEERTALDALQECLLAKARCLYADALQKSFDEFGVNDPERYDLDSWGDCTCPMYRFTVAPLKAKMQAAHCGCYVNCKHGLLRDLNAGLWVATYDAAGRFTGPARVEKGKIECYPVAA